MFKMTTEQILKNITIIFANGKMKNKAKKVSTLGTSHIIVIKVK